MRCVLCCAVLCCVVRGLVNIVVWFRSEKIQFDMLCEQSVANVWRMKAFSHLKEHHTQVGSHSITEDKYLQRCVVSV